MMTTQIRIIPTGGALGAEIQDVDLQQPLSTVVVQQLRRALLDHCVIFFRNQQISEEDQVRFTNYFGCAVEHVRKQPDRPIKEIFIISNVTENGKPIGALGNGELRFHSDLSYMPQPGTISTLYAVEIPNTGGETQWCNCYAAYTALADDLKQQLRGLRAIHRHYLDEQNPPEPTVHPMVCTHPETGEQTLFISPDFVKAIVGMDTAASQSLLDRLFAHMTQPCFIWTHHWQVGDLVMWDNRPTMHRREPFPASERRIMKRTQVFNSETPQA